MWNQRCIQHPYAEYGSRGKKLDVPITMRTGKLDYSDVEMRLNTSQSPRFVRNFDKTELRLNTSSTYFAGKGKKLLLFRQP